jgi:predicted RNase H-like nuclease
VNRPLTRRIGAQAPAFAMGVDGCPAGWCAVMVDMNGLEAPRTALFSSFQDVLNAGAQVIAVDMPIGFEDQPGPDGMRTCERLAREILGPRRSSIFPSPLRAALAAADYPEAMTLNRAAGGKGLSKQGWNLFPKLREIDALATPNSESFLFETHPETSFAVIAGAPAAHSKKTPEGRAERLALLERHGLPRNLFEPHPFKRKDAVPDDLIDAGLCALTALRIAAGTARSLPDDPPRDGRGLRMAIFA